MIKISIDEINPIKVAITASIVDPSEVYLFITFYI